MHKLFLTEPECSIIHGADKIIEELGGFPSMENGALRAFLVAPGEQYGRYYVILEFDIEGWYKTSSLYYDLKSGEHKLIRMTFNGVYEIFMDNRPQMRTCGEIKFDNTTDRKKMYQDNLPSNTPIVERPFCSFYIRAGELALLFSEEECRIEAEFV